MIPVASGVRIWIASGHTDMRKGMNGLALLVQEGLGRDPFAGDVSVFRGRAGSLIKALWMTGSGCRSTPSGSTVDGLSGLRRWMAWWR
jgi:transposase